MRLLLASVAVLAVMTGCARTDVKYDSRLLTWPAGDVQLVAAYTIELDPIGLEEYRVIDPPKVLVYSDGTVIADANRQLSLSEKELSDLVRALRRELDGLGPIAKARTDIMDANTTVLRVDTANGGLYSVSAYALGDRHPKRLRDAHARLEALRSRVATEGTAYTSDRVRFVVNPVREVPTVVAPWPVGVAVPPAAGLGHQSNEGVRTVDLTGEAAAQVIAALPDGPHPWGQWPVVHAPDDDGVQFSVAWRYLTPDE